MRRPAAKPADPAPRTRLREAAILLPLLATVLFLPPFVTVFSSSTLIFGVPVILAYMFGVWLALILLTAILARLLLRDTSGRE